MSLYLGEYHSLRLIGQGAFATIRKVRHDKLGYVRALKVLKDDVESESDAAYQTFLNECRVLLKLGNGCHPNIVRIYQPRFIENKAMVEMDYVEGCTLNDYITNRCQGFVEYDEFSRFVREIVGALAYCHVDIYRFLMNPEDDELQCDPNDAKKYLVSPEKERELVEKYGITHNDLHSNNIMRRDYDGSFVLLDFGLAIQQGHAVKSSSRRDGAMEYRSPEKWENDSVIDPRSDIYSLGVLLYEILAGRVPFVNDPSRYSTDLDALNALRVAHCQQQPPPIEPLRRQAFEASHPGQTYQKDYPDWVEAMIMKCLAKKPQERYANAKELFLDYKSRRSDSLSNTSVNVLELREALAARGEQIEALRRENAALHQQSSSAAEAEASGKALTQLQEQLAAEQSRNAYLMSTLKSREAELTSARRQGGGGDNKLVVFLLPLAILAVALSVILGVYAYTLKKSLGDAEETKPDSTLVDKGGSGKPEITDPKKMLEKGEKLEGQKEYEQAAEWYRKAAGLGNAEAQYKLGSLYFEGNGVRQDYSEAVKWLRLAAQSGVTDAQHQLGYCYDTGKGVSQDYSEAVSWYRKAADAGHATSMNNLAVCYEKGNGVPKDYDEALRWYRKAAEKGNAASMNSLGYSYQYGKGVETDEDAAVQWYRKAANKGNVSAMSNLGYCYAHGVGVSQDYAEAVRLYRAAADKGNSSAMNNLGYLYEKGNGVEQDYTEAAKWYQKAVDKGSETAKGNLERIQEKIEQ